jgi:hypothetical protein
MSLHACDNLRTVGRTGETKECATHGVGNLGAFSVTGSGHRLPEFARAGFFFGIKPGERDE